MPKQKSRKSKRPRQLKKAPSRKKVSSKQLKASIKKVPKRTIKRLTRPKFVTLDKASTRDIQKQWAYLKKLGLIKSKRRASKLKKNDASARRFIKKYREVLAGNAKVIKTSKKTAQGYKRAGEQVVGENVIISKTKKERVTKRGKLIFKRMKIDGGEMIIVYTPYSYADLQRGLDKIVDDQQIKKLIKQGWRFAFQYYGNFSYATFPNVELMREYLARYDSIQEGKVLKSLSLLIVLVGKKFHRPQRQRIRKRRSRRSQYETRRSYNLKRDNPNRWARVKEYQKALMRKRRASKKRKKK